MVALGREEGWRRGRRRISGKRLRSVEALKSQGMSNRAIAHRLGVNEKAIRKLVGPSKPESEQLALPAIATVAAKLAATDAPSAAPSGEGGDRPTRRCGPRQCRPLSSQNSSMVLPSRSRCTPPVLFYGGANFASGGVPTARGPERLMKAAAGQHSAPPCDDAHTVHPGTAARHERSMED